MSLDSQALTAPARASAAPSAARSSADTGGIKSVGKVLDILEFLADARRPVGVSEVARAVNFHVSTAHRLLRTLASRGYVDQDDALRQYVLGPRLLALSGAYRGSGMLLQVARPELERLRDAIGETIHLGVYRDRRVIEVASARSRQPVSVTQGAGFQDPAHCSALGKVLLAHLPADELTNLLAAGPLERRTPRSITRKPELLRALEAVRRDGFAVDEEELASDLCCLAVPVADASGRVIAALSVAMPKSRFRGGAIRRWSQALADAAARIGERLVPGGG
jgi:DNA-binding IclR family transcriptional regulator